MSTRAILLVSLALQVAGGGLCVADAQTALPVAPVAPASAGSAAGPAAVAGDYRIGLGDTLDIIVFQVPELTRTVVVDSSGKFTLPYVGQVSATGRTADELTSQLVQKLAGGGYLRDPQVTVVVKQAISQRVTVDGAVVKPGVYNLNGPTTLQQAVALASGADQKIANLHRVAIYRAVNGQRRADVYNLADIHAGKAPDPPVRADDIIVVETSGMRSFLAFYGGFLPLLRPY